VGIGSWEWFVKVGQELRENQIPLLDVCFIALLVVYSCDIS
jgi:hypothetical protein